MTVFQSCLYFCTFLNNFFRFDLLWRLFFPFLLGPGDIFDFFTAAAPLSVAMVLSCQKWCCDKPSGQAQLIHAERMTWSTGDNCHHEMDLSSACVNKRQAEMDGVVHRRVSWGWTQKRCVSASAVQEKKTPVDVFLVPLVLRWYMLFSPMSNNQWVFLSSVEYRSALHCCSWQNRLYEKMMISLAFKVRQFTLSTPLICVIYLLLTLVVKGRNTEAGVPALLVLCLEGWGRPAKAGI